MQRTGGAVVPESKRPAPISSSAFSFSLGSPVAKKPRTAPTSARPLATRPITVPVPPPPPVPAAAPARSTPHKSPVQPTSTTAEFGEDTASVPPRPPTTPLKASTYRPLDTLPSPFSLRPTPARGAGAGSPSGLSSAKGSRRPVTALDDTASPFRLVSGDRRDARKGGKDMQGISSGLDVIPVAEISERRRLMDEEEGIGVSPRKANGTIHHKGPGLLSSSDTSLVLFYTSLQHVLGRGPSSTAATACPAVAQHVRSAAPLRLRLLAPVPGPTHDALMVRCEIVQWRGRAPAPLGEVLVVFQALPRDCPRLGVDPRVLAAAPASTPLPPHVAGVWEPHISTMPAADPAEEDTRVLFASRYLIAAAPPM